MNNGRPMPVPASVEMRLQAAGILVQASEKSQEAENMDDGARALMFKASDEMEKAANKLLEAADVADGLNTQKLIRK